MAAVAEIALVIHQQRNAACVAAREAARWLLDEGHVVRFPESDARLVGFPELAAETHELASSSDLAVSLGGDGTMLRTVELVSAAGVPVLGVDLGRLGYLTDVLPEDLRSALERFLAGDYDIEHRMMLAVGVDSPSGDAVPGVHHGLNELVLEKTLSGHTVRLAVSLDGEPFITYQADGLIVATPTGSTAYSLSARGPIVAPTHRAVLITPVSPHMLFDRSLIEEPDCRVRIEVVGHRPATLSVDGRSIGTLSAGDAVTCTGADYTAQLVTFGPRPFHRILVTKFGLSDPRAPE